MLRLTASQTKIRIFQQLRFKVKFSRFISDSLLLIIAMFIAVLEVRSLLAFSP